MPNFSEHMCSMPDESISVEQEAELAQTLRGIYGVDCRNYQNKDTDFELCQQQLLKLLDYIYQLNTESLGVFKVFHDNVAKLHKDSHDDDLNVVFKSTKRSIEICLPAITKRAKAEKIDKNTFAHLTVDACYQGACSNMEQALAFFHGRGHLFSRVKVALSECVLQLAKEYSNRHDSFDYPRGNEIHVVNTLYNHVSKDYGLKTIEDSYVADFEEKTDSILNGWAIYLAQHFTVSYFLNYCHVFFESPPYKDVVDVANFERLKRFFEDLEQPCSRNAYLALYDEEYDDNLNLILKPKAADKFNFVYACMLADYLERAGFIDQLTTRLDGHRYLYQGRELVNVTELVNDKGEKTSQYHRLSKDERAPLIDNPDFASLELWRQLEPDELIKRYLKTPEDKYFQHLLTLPHLPGDDIMTLFYAIVPNKKSQLAVYVFTHNYPALTLEELNHISILLPNAAKKKAINHALKTDNDLYFRALIAIYPDLLGDASLLFDVARAGASTIIGSLYELGVDLSITDILGRTVAHIAADQGHANVIAKLGELNLELLSAKDLYGDTVAQIAVSKGDVNLIAKLGELNLDLLSAKNSYGDTAAHIAACKGDVNLIAKLGELNLELLSAKNLCGDTVAHIAARKGDVNLIAKLGELNLELLSAKDLCGYTAAQIAARNGDVNLIAKLGELNLDLLRAKDSLGRTAAHLAARKGGVNLIAKLGELSLELLSAKDLCGDTVAHIATSNGDVNLIAKLGELNLDLLRAKDSLGLTAAHLAARKGDVNLIAKLGELNLGLLNAKDNLGRTVAHIAASKRDINLIAKLGELNADLLNAKDNCDQTAAHIAAYNGYEAMIAKLGELKVDLNAKDNYGQTALHIAAHNGHTNVIAQLDRLKIDLGVKDNKNLTAAHLAAHKGHINVIAQLAEADRDLLNTKDKEGWTIAHYAARQGHVDVIAQLSELNLDLLSAKNNSGRTAAHIAAYNGYEAMIAELGKLKVDLNAKDNFGQTAAHTAALHDHMNVIVKLRELDKNLLKTKDNKGLTPLNIIASTKPSHPLAELVLGALGFGCISSCLGALAAAIALIAMTQAVLIPVVACAAVMTVGVIGLASIGFFSDHIKYNEKAAESYLRSEFPM